MVERVRFEVGERHLPFHRNHTPPGVDGERRRPVGGRRAVFEVDFAGNPVRVVRAVQGRSGGADGCGGFGDGGRDDVPVAHRHRVEGVAGVLVVAGRLADARGCASDRIEVEVGARFVHVGRDGGMLVVPGGAVPALHQDLFGPARDRRASDRDALARRRARDRLQVVVAGPRRVFGHFRAPFRAVEAVDQALPDARVGVPVGGVAGGDAGVGRRAGNALEPALFFARRVCEHLRGPTGAFQLEGQRFVGRGGSDEGGVEADRGAGVGRGAGDAFQGDV